MLGCLFFFIPLFIQKCLNMYILKTKYNMLNANVLVKKRNYCISFKKVKSFTQNCFQIILHIFLYLNTFVVDIICLICLIRWIKIIGLFIKLQLIQIVAWRRNFVEFIFNFSCVKGIKRSFIYCWLKSQCFFTFLETRWACSRKSNIDMF